MHALSIQFSRHSSRASSAGELQSDALNAVVREVQRVRLLALTLVSDQTMSMAFAVRVVLEDLMVGCITDSRKINALPHRGSAVGDARGDLVEV